MIPNKEGLHDLAVTKLASLLRGIKSKHNGYLYCCVNHATNNMINLKLLVCERN